MKINVKESSTKRGIVGILFAMLCLLIIIFDDDYASKIAVLLTVAKFVSDWMKITIPDNE